MHYSILPILSLMYLLAFMDRGQFPVYVLYVPASDDDMYH